MAFNVAGAPTVEFNVPDMMCPEGCGAKTKEILSEQPGAKEVVINFDAKTATVAIEEGKFDPDAAIAALVDHGFENSTLKTAATRRCGRRAAKPAAERSLSLGQLLILRPIEDRDRQHQHGGDGEDRAAWAADCVEHHDRRPGRRSRRG